MLSPQRGSVRITRNLAWRLRIPKPVDREKSYFSLCDIVLDLMHHITLAKFYSLSESQRPAQFQWKGEKLQLLMHVWERSTRVVGTRNMPWSIFKKTTSHTPLQINVFIGKGFI